MGGLAESRPPRRQRRVVAGLVFGLALWFVGVVFASSGAWACDPTTGEGCSTTSKTKSSSTTKGTPTTKSYTTSPTTKVKTPTTEGHEESEPPSTTKPAVDFQPGGSGGAVGGGGSVQKPVRPSTPVQPFVVAGTPGPTADVAAGPPLAPEGFGAAEATPIDAEPASSGGGGGGPGGKLGLLALAGVGGLLAGAPAILGPRKRDPVEPTEPEPPAELTAVLAQIDGERARIRGEMKTLNQMSDEVEGTRGSEDIDAQLDALRAQLGDLESGKGPLHDKARELGDQWKKQLGHGGAP